jgi:hypothetical protein
VKLRAVTADQSAADDAVVQARLIKPDGTVEGIAIGRSGEQFTGAIDEATTAVPGLYRLEAIAARGGQTIGQSEREFVVMDRDREKANPAANPDQIVRLANETKAFGGRKIDPERFGDLLDEINANPPTSKIEVPTTWRLGQTLPDATAYLLLLVVLLTTEWALRKKWGMI